MVAGAVLRRPLDGRDPSEALEWPIPFEFVVAVAGVQQAPEGALREWMQTLQQVGQWVAEPPLADQRSQ